MTSPPPRRSSSHGRKVSELEKALAGYTENRFAIGVNSGTDATRSCCCTASSLQPGQKGREPSLQLRRPPRPRSSLTRMTAPLSRRRPGQLLRSTRGSATAAVTNQTRAPDAAAPVPRDRRGVAALDELVHRHRLGVIVKDGAEADRDALGRPARRPAQPQQGACPSSPPRHCGTMSDTSIDPDRDDKEVARVWPAFCATTASRPDHEPHRRHLQPVPGCSSTTARSTTCRPPLLMTKLSTSWTGTSPAGPSSPAASARAPAGACPGPCYGPPTWSIERDQGPTRSGWLTWSRVERRDELVRHLTERGIEHRHLL